MFQSAPIYYFIRAYGALLHALPLPARSYALLYTAIALSAYNDIIIQRSEYLTEEGRCSNLMPKRSTEKILGREYKYENESASCLPFALRAINLRLPFAAAHILASPCPALQHNGNPLFQIQICH